MTAPLSLLDAPGGEGAAVEEVSAEVAPGLIPPRRRRRSPCSLAEVAVELGFVSRERADAALEEGRASGRRPETVLLESNALTQEQLARATADRLGLDYVDLTIYEPDLAVATLLTEKIVKRYGAIPIGFAPDGRLLVAMADPSNVLALDDLKLITGHELRSVVAPSEDLAALIGRMSRLDEAVAQAVEEEAEEVGQPADVTEIKESADDAPVIRLVNSVIAQAVGDGASDIHFEPDGRDMRVRFRVDGVLAERTTIPRLMVAGVVSRVKIMGELDISERRVPQDGRMSVKIEGHTVDIRIVTTPSVRGEGIVMRLLERERALLTLDTLGIRDAPRARFEEAARLPYGAILVTGPTGSGKSTTLYAALTAINSVEKNVITIEDPVEYQLAGVTQIQVHQRAGVTFASGLRSMLRADPDIIMVGEIRDSDTARIAVESALTGHLVLSTLHTNDAASAIARLTEMGVEPFLTASAVECVVAQRLARTLCIHCKKLAVVSAESLRAAGYRATVDIEAYEGVGCARCNFTGYRGRIGLYEVMGMSEEIRSLTVERAPASTVREAALRNGMRLLRDDGLDKVRLGITSIAEVSRVS